MNQTPLRVGIVGAGANTQKRHIPGLQAIDGVEILSVVNRTQESSRKAAQQFGIGETASDWRALVRDSRIDAVVIGTWPYLHCPITVAALEAGKHVLCEARMARNAAEARAMQAAAMANPHLVAQIVPSPLTLKFDATIRRLLAAGYVGDVLAIELRAGGGFVDREAELHWRHDTELSGLNIMSMGIWYEALLRWVGDATRVLARGRTFVPTRHDGEGNLHSVSVPDHLDIIAQMACGAQANLQFSTVTGLDQRDAVTIYGSEGTLRLSQKQLYGGQRGSDRLEPIEIPPEEEGHWRVEEEFIAAIRREQPVQLTTFADGVRYMEFTQAVAESLSSGQEMPVRLQAD